MNALGWGVVIGTWALVALVFLIDCYIATVISDWVSGQWGKR